MLAYVTDRLNSPPPDACPLQPPWDHHHPATVTSSLAADDDDDHVLRRPDFRYARRDVIGDVMGAYERPATQCRDCCSVEMGLAAENSSHAHHYQPLYQ